MPHTYTKKELEERYKKLPSALKDAMFSPDVAEQMFEIGKKNGLTIEKTGFMAEETGFVILGLTPPREFVGILKDRLEVTRDAASKIASEINHAVFFPLREQLKNTHNIEVSEGELQKEEVIIKKPMPLTQPLTPPAMPPIAPKRQEPISESKKPVVPAEIKPAPPMPEKKPEPATELAIPGFISREETEKIVAEEKEKRQAPLVEQTPTAPAAPEKTSVPQILPASKPAPAPTEIDLRGQKLSGAEQVTMPQQRAISAAGQAIIPKPSTTIPQEVLQPKNMINLRGSAPMPALPAPPPLPQPPPEPPAAKPMMPPPIIIPHTPNPDPLPEEMRPQNPKIQPIDLRNIKPKEAPKKYDGYDPYREPVE